MTAFQSGVPSPDGGDPTTSTGQNRWQLKMLYIDNTISVSKDGESATLNQHMQGRRLPCSLSDAVTNFEAKGLQINSLSFTGLGEFSESFDFKVNLQGPIAAATALHLLGKLQPSTIVPPTEPVKPARTAPVAMEQFTEVSISGPVGSISAAGFGRTIENSWILGQNAIASVAGKDGPVSVLNSGTIEKFAVEPFKENQMLVKTRFFAPTVEAVQAITDRLKLFFEAIKTDWATQTKNGDEGEFELNISPREAKPPKVALFQLAENLVAN
jgi:hypothetical protein